MIPGWYHRNGRIYDSAHREQAVVTKAEPSLRSQVDERADKILRAVNEHENQHTLLTTLRDYFKDRADVAADCTEGTTPNAEARILAQIDEQLAANRGEQTPPWRKL